MWSLLRRTRRGVSPCAGGASIHPRPDPLRSRPPSGYKDGPVGMRDGDGRQRRLIAAGWDARATVSLHGGDTLELLRCMPAAVAQLVITSPPYNIGKSYERRRSLDEYLAGQAPVIAECVRIL